MENDRDPKKCKECGTVNSWLTEVCRDCGAELKPEEPEAVFPDTKVDPVRIEDDGASQQSLRSEQLSGSLPWFQRQ